MLNPLNKNAWQGSALPALVPASFQESDEEDDPEGTKPFDIHQYFGLSPETPICLDSLKDPDPGQKPPYTYATLVKLAIWSSPQRKLTLSGIYDALERRFPWFKTCENPNAWKTSIRHSLSLLAVFQKMSPDLCEPVKGHYWTVDFSKGEGYKRPRKRGKSKKAVAQEAPDKEVDGEVEAPAEVQTVAADSPRSDVTSSASSSMRVLTPPPSAVGRPAREGMQDVQIPGPPNPRIPRVRRQTQEWQEEQERMNRVFAPFSKVIQLEAVSPDERYRHYRMCTYLYPEDPQQKTQSPTELDLELLERTRLPRAAPAQDRPPAQPNPPVVDPTTWNAKYTEQPEQFQFVSHGSNGSGPILSAVRDSRAANAVPEPEPPRPLRSAPKAPTSVEYFAPSAASFQAYQAASVATARFRSRSSDDTESPPPESSPAGESQGGRTGGRPGPALHHGKTVRSALTREHDGAIEPTLGSPNKKRKITYNAEVDLDSEEDEIDELLDDD